MIGEHDGAVFYTIGQRIGMGLDKKRLKKLWQDGGFPYDPAKMPAMFVTGKNTETNTLTLGFEVDTRSDHCVVGDLNLLVAEKEFETSLGDCFVRIRNTGKLVRASLALQCDETVLVELSEDLSGVAAGQACVFYSSGDKDAVVLGGGIIQEG